MTLLQLAAVAVAALVGAVYFTRVEYPQHSSGLVLITGASSGIGRHAAEYLAASGSADGFTVLAAVRKVADFDSIAALRHPRLRPVLLDVADHESCVQAVATVRTISKETGLPLVALVNNAGVSRRGVAEFHDLQDARNVFETNLWGAIDLVQLTLPLLRESRGRIVMISSLSGLVGSPISGIYVASKFALEGFSDSLRRETAPFNISVSVVEPGYVKTAIFNKHSAVDSEQSPHYLVPLEQVAALYPALHSEATVAKRRRVIELASTTDVTTEAIAHAITSKFPKTRYAVANAGGVPAAVVAFLGKVLPDRVLDILMKM